MEIFRTECSYVLVCGESSLWINKKTSAFSVHPAWELANGHDPECLGIFFGLIGRIRCPGLIDDHILLVRESVLVGELPSGHSVHKIKSVAIFCPASEVSNENLGLKRCPKHHRTVENQEQSITNSAISKTWSSFRTATNIKTSSQQVKTAENVQDEKKDRRDLREKERYQRRIFEELHRIFTDTDSFYYCPAGGDITNSVYRQFEIGSENIEKGYIWDYVDDRFFWNKHMIEDIMQLKSPLSEIWIMPIIQGYVEIRECKLDFGENQKHEVFVVSLISRRSRYRVGTRYKRRGVDDDGHCANYVETEQIVQYKKHVVSFVQIRGSIPLYWSQQGYKYRPPPQLHKSYEENQLVLEKHLKAEMDQYGPLIIVNLVERSGKEAVVGDAYADHVCTFDNPDIIYVTFDFHYYCRGMHFENVGLLVDELQDEIAKMAYCWIDKHGLISKQNGIFRVNCIDCLDRTNIVQTAIAREVLIAQMIKLGLMSPESPNHLSLITQQMWANNGDIISKQYAGTNALKGDITRTGGRKLSGMMKDSVNSANRYYLSRFKDTTRQATLDIMLGNPVDESVIRRKDHNGSSSSSSSSDDEDVIMEDEKTVEHVKQVIEDIKNMLVEDSAEVLAAWGLVNADAASEDVPTPEMDAVLVLTRNSCFVVEYDPELDKMTKFEEISLTKLKLLELLVWQPADQQNSQKLSPRKQITCSPLLSIHFLSDQSVVQRTFKATNLRFFNNVAVVIKSDEEKVESLRAICNTIQATFQHNGFGDLEFTVHSVQKKHSLFSPETLSSFKPSDIQLSSFRNVGSKAISNVSQQFSKINKLGQHFRYGKSKTKPKEETEEPEKQDSEVSGELMIPAGDLVMSQMNSTGGGNKDGKCSATPDIIIEAAATGSSEEEARSVVMQYKSHSTQDINKMVDAAPVCINRSGSYKDLSLSLNPATCDESKLNSLRSGFTTAASALVSPSSPLSRLAKGVQYLGLNLDLRRLKTKTGQTGFSPQILENTKVKEKWKNSGCKSKLIAL